MRPGLSSFAGRFLTVVLGALAGLLIVASALDARGTDLRPARHTDLVSLLQAQSRRNAELTERVTTLRAEVDELSAGQSDQTDLGDRLAERQSVAGLTAVSGPAVSITLDDAPESVTGTGVDPDLLVVHQQDIQAVVNALWSGGAEAMSIQGQRVVSTTGIKCVGNTVVLHGVPHAPPYVIIAIGDQPRLRAALVNAEPVQIYRQYVEAYGLVYRERSPAEVTLGPYEGSVDLEYAQPPVPGAGE